MIADILQSLLSFFYSQRMDLVFLHIRDNSLNLFVCITHFQMFMGFGAHGESRIFGEDHDDIASSEHEIA